MIGEKIAELRRQNNMSQEELAERLGISRQSVSKWESGQSLPDIEKLPILSDLFHVSIDYLVKEDTVPAVAAAEPEPETNEAPFQKEETPFRDARFRDWQEECTQNVLLEYPERGNREIYPAERGSGRVHRAARREGKPRFLRRSGMCRLRSPDHGNAGNQPAGSVCE